MTVTQTRWAFLKMLQSPKKTAYQATSLGGLESGGTAPRGSRSASLSMCDMDTGSLLLMFGGLDRS